MQGPELMSIIYGRPPHSKHRACVLRVPQKPLSPVIPILKSPNTFYFSIVKTIEGMIPANPSQCRKKEKDKSCLSLVGVQGTLRASQSEALEQDSQI